MVLLKTIVMRQTLNFHAVPTKATTGGDQFNCPGISITDRLETASVSMDWTRLKQWPMIPSYHSRLPCGIGPTTFNRWWARGSEQPLEPSMVHLSVMVATLLRFNHVLDITETIAANLVLLPGIILNVRIHYLNFKLRCTFKDKIK